MKIDKIVLELIGQKEAASKAGDWATFRAIDKAINARGWTLANEADPRLAEEEF